MFYSADLFLSLTKTQCLHITTETYFKNIICDKSWIFFPLLLSFEIFFISKCRMKLYSLFIVIKLFFLKSTRKINIYICNYFIKIHVLKIKYMTNQKSTSVFEFSPFFMSHEIFSIIAANKSSDMSNIKTALPVGYFLNTWNFSQRENFP